MAGSAALGVRRLAKNHHSPSGQTSPNFGGNGTLAHPGRPKPSSDLKFSEEPSSVAYSPAAENWGWGESQRTEVKARPLPLHRGEVG